MGDILTLTCPICGQACTCAAFHGYIHGDALDRAMNHIRSHRVEDLLDFFENILASEYSSIINGVLEEADKQKDKTRG